MRFLVDECTGPAVALWLRRQDHYVISVEISNSKIKGRKLLNRLIQ